MVKFIAPRCKISMTSFPCVNTERDDFLDEKLAQIYMSTNLSESRDLVPSKPANDPAR